MYSLVLFVSMSTLVLINRVESECNDKLVQYYQCKNLKMAKHNYSGHVWFYPNSSIPNNTLTDAFFNRTLSNKTFNQAMDIIRQVYLESTCNNDTCLCIRARSDGDYYAAKYREFFINSTTYTQFRNIILTFINNNKQFMYRDWREWSIYNNFPSVHSFCHNNEFTSTRFYYYNQSVTNCKMYNESVSYF